MESLKDLPKVRAYLQAVQEDNSLNNDEKLKKVKAMLFDWSKAVKSGKVK